MSVKIDNPRMSLVLSKIEQDDRVLDLGCVQHNAFQADTENWLHKYLYEITDDVVGIDIEKEEISELVERGYNIKYADAENFDLGRKFDVVIAGELIEHLSCPGGMLQSVQEHLVSDGRLILTTPNPWTFDAAMMALVADSPFTGYDDVPVSDLHTCWFDRPTLTTLLNRNGFKIDDFRYVSPGTNDEASLQMKFRAKVLTILYKGGFEKLGGPRMVVTALPET